MLNKLDSKKQSLTKDHPAQQTDDGRVEIDKRAICKGVHLNMTKDEEKTVYGLCMIFQYR